MPFCSTCGQEYPAQANFCLHCGTQVSYQNLPANANKESQVTLTIPINCPKCGRMFPVANPFLAKIPKKYTFNDSKKGFFGSVGEQTYHQCPHCERQFWIDWDM